MNAATTAKTLVCAPLFIFINQINLDLTSIHRRRRLLWLVLASALACGPGQISTNWKMLAILSTIIIIILVAAAAAAVTEGDMHSKEASRRKAVKASRAHKDTFDPGSLSLLHTLLDQCHFGHYL